MGVNTYFPALLIFFSSLIFTNATNEVCNKNRLNKPSSLKIKELILCDYNKLTRPVLEEGPLIISTYFSIYNFDFFERKNRITIKGWGAMKWRDEHIYWEPSDYNNNLTAITMSSNDVWRPDLIIVNANKFNSKLLPGGTLCVAFYNKMLICPFPIHISGLCKADFTYWPFDSHNCTVSIESFYHRGDKIDFNDTETDLHIVQKYKSSWDIIDSSVIRSPGAHKCCPNISYPSLKLNFLVKRHNAGSIAFILIPVIILTSITILAIWLNPKSPERMYITAVNICYHTYYLLNSTWELPRHSDGVPKLILLIRNSQMLATFIIIETVVIRYILNKRSDSPRWLIHFISVLTTNIFGQIFLYPELYANNSIKDANADDVENLVEGKSELKEWDLLGIFLDRFIFYSLIFVYIVMFINCIPN